MPLITLPTRITSSSKTLIDNILYNQFNPNIKSGNLTVSISDHTPQFAIIPLANKNYLPKNHNIHVRDYKNLNHTMLLDTFQSINWNFSNESDINEDINVFFQTANSIIDDLAPLRKITNKEYKLKSKPWITKAIIKSIKQRDNIYRRLTKEKYSIKKYNFQYQIRILKNKIKTLIRASKKDYFKNYFAKNANNAKNLWKGINEIISSKTKSNTTINCLEITNEDKTTSTVTDPKDISNIAVNYFTNIADEILKKRKYNGNKHFTDYLKSPNANSFFTNPTDPKEIESIIKLFDPNKSVGPNSLPPKILKLLATQISTPISEICNK